MAGLFLLVGATAAGADALALPACIPPIEVAHAKIVRVEKNGVLVLADGRAAHLEGIMLPAGAGDDAPESFAGQAIAALSDLATGHFVSLAARPPKEDRYGRLRAQVLVDEGRDDAWLQIAMLRGGWARVFIAPDRRECADELYAAEARARASNSGIWSAAAYHVRTPAQATADEGTFQIVEGRVRSVAKHGGRVFLEFGSDLRSDFAVTISSDDLRNFREIGVDPFSYADAAVRARGWIERLRGHAEMEVALPDDIEIVDSQR